MRTRLARYGSPVFAVVSGEAVWLRSGHGVLRLSRSDSLLGVLDDIGGWARAPESLRRALAAHGVRPASPSSPQALMTTCPSPLSVPAALTSLIGDSGAPVPIDLATRDDASSTPDRPALGYLHSGRNVLVGLLMESGPCPRCLRDRLRATYPFAVGDAPLADLLDLPVHHVDPGHRRCVAAQRLLTAVVGRALTGAGTLLEVHPAPARVRLRPLLPLPNCPGCGGRASSAARVDRGTLGVALRRYLALADARTGVVAGVTVRPYGKLFEARTRTRIDTRWFSSVRAYTGGAAVKPRSEEAVVAALGEAYERYAAGVVRRESLRRARFAEVADRAVDPRRLLDLTTAGGRLAAADLDDRRAIEWVPVVAAEGGPAALVPAAAVYLPYPERGFTRQSSIGLAAGTSRDDAVGRGLSEVVERLAWRRTWRARAIRARLGVEPCCGPVTRLLDAVSADGSSVWAADITALRGAHSVVAGATRAAGPGPCALAMGLGTAATAHEALVGALCEVAQSQLHLAELLRSRDVPANAAAVRTTDDRYLFYCRPERLARLGFLWRSGAAATVPHLPAVRLDRGLVCRELARRSLRVLVADLTPADLRTAGVHVVRVLVAADRVLPTPDEPDRPEPDWPHGPPPDWPPPGC